MKQTPLHQTARATLAILLTVTGIFLLALAFSNLFAGSRARVPKVMDVTGPTPFSGTYDPHPFPCATARHSFTVPAGEVRIIVQTTATVPTNDLSVSLLYGSGANPVFITTQDAATSTEALVWEPAGGVPAGVYQVQVCQTPTPNGVPQMAPYDYNGTFSTDNTHTVGGPPPVQFGPIAPAPVDNGPKVGYETFLPPGDIVSMTSSSQGPSAATVEYIGHDAGEPSVGVNWNSAQDTLHGITAFQSDLQTVFVKFDDSCPANGATASWYRSQSPTSEFVDSDPIGFVDRVTGRVFCGQLTLLSPTCKISFTDTDGKDPLGNPNQAGWIASSGPLGSGVDHETIGGGPYHSPLPPTLPAGYPHAVYYMSQDIVGPAFAFRSDDGGAHFLVGPIDMWTTECGGLHGHAKVTPNTAATVANGKVGTVFLPNNSCGNNGAVVVSEDNGLTWNIRPIGQTTSNPNFQDPAVAIDNNGRVYFGMSSNVAAGPGNPGGSQMVIATSDDNGQTWQQVFDVGGVYGLKNVMYPAAVAGDGGRAAVAFFGSTTGGDPTIPSFTGIWHLYVAHTFDGGAHWTTTDSTPNDPIQRGPIWAHGAADIARNMLDFYDMTVDKQGRVQVGYADGCVDAHCVQASNTAAGNAYTARMAITRQSGGRRMFVANDPTLPTKVPGMPIVTAKRAGQSQVRVQWSLGDDGNSPITGYDIWRGTSSGGETFLTTRPATDSFYDDLGANDATKTYYYKVFAVNGVGASCGNNEVAAPYLGNTCTGLIVQKTPPNHPEQTAQGNAPPSLAIDYIAVGEPPGSSDLLFKMKVTDLSTVPPNSRWRMLWNSYSAVPLGPQPPNAVAQQFYIGMTTDMNSNVTFEYGVVATAVVGLAVGVPTETELGSVANNGMLAGATGPSAFHADGTITMRIPKSIVGNPQPGDLLGAVNGRTFTGDNDQTKNLERSTLLIDHTFVKAQRDNGHPAATYTLVGNNGCAAGAIAPVRAVSRKFHNGVGNFDVELPLVGPRGIECRTANDNTLKIVITFGSPVSINGGVQPQATVTPPATVDMVTINASVVTVDLGNVPNAQYLQLTLNNVSDGVNSGPVVIPFGVLLADVDASAQVDGNDVSAVQGQTRPGTVDATNFRMDVNRTGLIDGNDVSVTQGQTRTGISASNDQPTQQPTLQRQTAPRPQKAIQRRPQSE